MHLLNNYYSVLGLAFLIQWTASLYLYFYDYFLYYNSILVWSLPLCGFIQSIGATLTFTFLPKKQTDPGYYSDKSTLSYNFVKENIYFAGLLLFQFLYMHDKCKLWITNYIPYVIESTIVFLPYILIRPLFPKTSFRASLSINDKNKTEKNKTFFIVVTWITKIFYVWAKHYIGFFLNYARFLDRISPELVRHIYFMLIMSSAATTISMFLHTLKVIFIVHDHIAYFLPPSSRGTSVPEPLICGTCPHIWPLSTHGCVLWTCSSSPSTSRCSPSSAW